LKRITAIVISISSLTLGIGVAKATQAPEPHPTHHTTISTTRHLREDQPRIVFQHGDISWLPILASQAGWPRKTWAKLGTIILRESGGCPNRIGSSIVDKNCNITGYTKATNKSDSGLLQINGVNYNLERNDRAAVCLAGIACEQAPLLDALTNLKAGFVLFKIAGWDPWTPPPGGW
jgi:hypothetical protein